MVKMKEQIGFLIKFITENLTKNYLFVIAVIIHLV